MTYIINKTDGSELTQLGDSVIDQISTDLTLIGKNSSNYGEVFNENLVKLLENFANTSQPTYPITGQIWFDKSDNRLKVFTGTEFRTSGGPIVSSDANTPLTLIQGDLWINNLTNQLWFYDGTETVLAGPSYTAQQGISGQEVVNLTDVAGNLKTVVKLWVSQKLLGIFSKETFTPNAASTANLVNDGYTGIIKVGFNASTLSGIKFNVTASKADALVTPGGDIKGTSSFVATDGSSSIAGQLSIQNAVPLILGNQDSEIRVSNSSFQIVSNRSGQNFIVKVKSGSGTLVEAINVNAVDQYVGIFNAVPAATLDVTGNALISGDVAISGNLTTAWNVISAAYTAVNGDKLLVDTTSVAFAIQLPANPQIGWEVTFMDGSATGWDTNNLTVTRDTFGRKINGATSNLVANKEGGAFTLVFTGINRGWCYKQVDPV
jgi:hypothetical protein